MRASKFVNPYQFVALQPVVREEPLGHAAGGTRVNPVYSGQIQVSWTLISPLLIPNDGAESGWVEDGKFTRIPGSSVRGAVRSLHEAMFNGCLRVFDDSFLPAYRMPVGPTVGKGLRLARVEGVNDAGGGLTLRLCREHRWVDAPGLHAAYQRFVGAGVLPTSGDVVRLTGDGTRSPLGRTEVRRIHHLERIDEPPTTGDQVFLVTDTRARKGFRRRGDGGCFWATAELTDVEVTAERPVLQDFRTRCAGSRDTQEQAAAQPPDRFPKAMWWLGGRQQPIARRLAATGDLHPGDIVWVGLNESDSTQVSEIRLAVAWRKLGKDRAGSRLGFEPGDHRSPMPCNPTSSAAHLCMSCSIFGAIDAAGDEAGRGRQDAYAGHVRFTAALVAEPTPVRAVARLAPMGSPHPGAGMFYLAHRETDGGRERKRDETATEWGSDLDHGRRALRGRKFYWHSNPDQQQRDLNENGVPQQRPRYEAAPHHSTEMTRPALLAPEGSTFTVTLAIDQLDELSVRSLLLALDPTPLLKLAAPHHPGATVHFGGGKPLGLGSAKVSHDLRIDVRPLADRYSEGSTSAPDWAAPLKSFAPALQERVGRFTQNVPALAALLNPSALGADASLVTYPPGAAWAEANTRDFHDSFRFFTLANGQQYAGETNPYYPLAASPALPDQTLPIVTKSSRRAGGGRRGGPHER